MNLDDTVKWLSIVYREATTEEYMACVRQQGFVRGELKHDEMPHEQA